MKLGRPGRACAWAALGLLAASLCPVWGQARYRYIEEPQWLKLRLTQLSAGVYMEGNYEQTSYNNSTTTATYERFFVGPLLGLDLIGSIYHPNFCRLTFDSEGALGWEDVRVSSTTSSHTEQLQYLGRINGRAMFLVNKPYNATVFGNFDHTYRDYDFFTRVTVDAWRYGADLSYSLEPLSLNAGYAHRDESVSGEVFPSQAHEDTFVFNAAHTRAQGGTTLTYTHNIYSRTDFGQAGEGNDHTVSLGDNEQFGDRRQFNLNTGISYYLRETDNEASEQLSAQASFDAIHLYNLRSHYDFNFDRYQQEGFTSDNYYADAYLRHQLYESLSSTFSLQGANYEAYSGSANGYTRQYGGGIAEVYTKRLTPEHQLRVDASVFAQHVDTKSVDQVVNEPHTFSEGNGAPPGSFFLNHVNVIASTIVITDANNTQPPYVPGVDYTVIQNGVRTLIQRLNGSRIGPAQVVLADYRTTPSPAGSYENLTEYFQVRFDLWTYLWGLYGRVTRSENNAPAAMLVPELSIYTIGTDVSWRWLRAGAEAQQYDATDSQYRSISFYESLMFNVDATSTFTLDCSQSWINYETAERQEQNYRFVARYRTAVTARLQASIEAGAAIRRGEGVDQTLATFRPNLQYQIGLTTISAGYDFEYEMFLNSEVRFKNLLFLRLRRIF